MRSLHIIYYVGNCFESEVEAGYTVGKFLGEQDAKNVAIITTTKGDTTGDAREMGLQQACEEFGMKVVGEARGLVQASDVTNAVESFLAANKDLDAIFCVGTTVTSVQEIAVKAVKDSGRDNVQVVCIDHPDGITALFETGILTYSLGLPSFALDPYLCILKIVNAAQGYPIGSSKGDFSSNSMTLMPVTNVEEAKVFEAAGSDPEYVFFDQEQLKSMLRWINPAFDEEALQKLLDDYQL